MNKLYTPLIALVFAAPTLAETEQKPKSEIEVGIIVTSGNTETESYKGKVDINYDLKRWRNRYIFEGLYKRDEVILDLETGETARQTTANKIFVSGQGDYKIDKEYAAFFIYGEYERNRFSGFDYQYTIAVGYADRLFTTDNSHLAYDIGPGYSVDQPEVRLDENDVLIDPDQEESVIIRLSARYLYQISETAKFTQEISSNYSTESDGNSKTKSVSAITAQLNSSLALRASYAVDYNSEVPVDRKNTDTATSVTAVYSF